ncbi:hypothetical protein PINS_up004568 [Pythium insidiosum]|nr:hypothetical protein PINS_up004568 [Pythium insidiosum]
MPSQRKDLNCKRKLDHIAGATSSLSMRRRNAVRVSLPVRLCLMTTTANVSECLMVLNPFMKARFADPTDRASVFDAACSKHPNAGSLKYAQLRVLPPFTFHNKCDVPMHVIVFVFKKVRRAGAQEREYSHIVASEVIPARGQAQFLSSSLNEPTYCSISMTGFSWSKIFLLPSNFDSAKRVTQASTQESKSVGDSSRQPSSTSSSGSSPVATPSSPRGQTPGCDVLCTVEDFKSRKASLCVAMVGSSSDSVARQVIIQPRFVICNETHLALLFEPHDKKKMKIPSAKSLFALTVGSKPAVSCCGSQQLEMIHTKLNALHGATTTSAPGQKTTSKLHATRESEQFFCSETNVVNIQLEGNTHASSGIASFRLDSAVGGSNSTIRLYDESKQQWQDVVVVLEPLDAVTTKVTFVERYVILNRTEYNLLCVPSSDISVGTSPDAANGSLLKPQIASPYHWEAKQTIPADPCVRLKLVDKNVTGWRWSGKFSLHEVSESALKLSNKFTSQVVVLRVEVRVKSSVRVFVVISSEDSAPYPLYKIINSSTKEMIHFKQCLDGASGDLAEHSSASVDFNRGVTQRLFPGESLCFGWDEAFFLQSLDRVLHISYSSDSTFTKVLLDQPGEARKVDIPATKSKEASTVWIHWYLNGVTKTIHIHDEQLPRDPLTGRLNVSSHSDTSSDGVRSMKRASVSRVSVAVKMPKMMLSILDSTPEEIFLLTAEGVDFLGSDQRNQHSEIEIKINSIQLDNQLSSAVFPVVFTPTPVNPSFGFLESPKKTAESSPKKRSDKAETNDGGERGKPDVDETFFHLSTLKLCYGDDVEYIKYLSAMLQPARVQIDDSLIMHAAVLFGDYIRIMESYFPPDLTRKTTVISEALAARETQEVVLRAPDDTAADPQPADRSRQDVIHAQKLPLSERRMFIETLELHPLKVQLTFQQNDLGRVPLQFQDTQSNLLLPVAFLILKSNLVNIDSASLTLNALHINHAFTTRTFMTSAIQQHYAFQGILQMYALVGAADILGNPLGLVTNLGIGVKDFFYEPMAGMVKSPQEFVYGLSRGTASLVKNSVYGTFNAASKFTGTLSSGIAALSMDNEYIRARNTRNRQNVATHIGTGLLYGTKQLGHGIIAGVSGVITAPAMGAYNNGLTGFVEGVGKGLIGVAVKPTAGILDLAAKTTAGITATATVFDKKARDTRMRLPRMLHTSDRRIRVYSNDEAMISQLLHRLPQKLLRNEHYETHVFLPQNRAVVATSHHFFLVDSNSLGGVAPTNPRVAWTFPVSNVRGAQKTPKGVNVFIGAATTVALSSPHGTAQPTVTKSTMMTVLIPLRESDTAVMDRLTKCISDLVAKHRERAPISETFSSPLPRNAIGLVLEPVRDSNKVPGYEGYGGRVVDVFVGSACFRAGVEVGDIIVGFGKNKFEAGDHGSALRTQLSTMKKGDQLELMVLRHGEIKSITVTTE